MAEDYAQQLEDLKMGKVEELVITPETFTAFQAVWTNFPNRKEFIGTADREGIIHYRYQSNEEG